MERDGRTDRPLAVAARGLEVAYGRDAGRRALVELDLEVARGEVFGVLGPNGAGKTTLLGVLATRLAASAGTLALLGGDARRPARSLRRRIGVVPEEPAHIEALTGRENATFFARAAGLSFADARQRVGDLLERLGLASDADRPVSEYSHGMRRKLLLVEALVHRPDLLILDEPALGLDPPSRQRLGDLLGERAVAGAAIVLASNDVVDAEQWCGRVCFLHSGRKVLEGTPAELIRACGGTTRIECRLSAGRAPDVRVDGLDVALTTSERLVAHSARGLAPLPALCAAVLAGGAAIHAIEIRRPDLRDVFLRATGAELAAA
jgi:ABC-2 type transport system ATP-binding protein